MSIQKTYNQWAETYDTDENFTRDLNQAITEKVLGGLSFQTILEIGCGTGKNTPLLAELAHRVYAIDFSREMMTKAKLNVEAEQVTFCYADLTQHWTIADQSIDLVVCNLVLEHIADLDFIFREVARVLAQAGRFFVSELHPFLQYQGKQANFQRTDEVTEIPAFVHHISDFLHAANLNGLRLLQLSEWWHELDQGKPPRLVSFMFEKQINSP